MWVLKSTKDEVCYYLLTGVTYAIGRKETDILIHGDPSVSRRHASLFVLHTEENLTDASKIPVLQLKDEHSKYGTFRNGRRVGDAEMPLKSGDMVKFGQFESEFSVTYSPVVVTTSCLDVSSKLELKRVLLKLGGHLLSEWQPSCTHLVMSHIKVTVKALCCMVSLKPIVLPSYFSDLEESVLNKTAFPEANKYIPPIGEPLLDKKKVSFDVLPDRKVIFKDKNFVFLDEKQYKKMHLGITLGSGNAIILNEDKPFDPSFISSINTCVVQPFSNITDSKLASLIKDISLVLQRNKRRLIPESDFGLAVAYCSTKRYCNPDFDIGSALLGSSKLISQTFSQQEVYVPDTEVISKVVVKKEPPDCSEENCIPATASTSSKTTEESLNNDTRSKKDYSNDEESSSKYQSITSLHPNKKIKTESSSSAVTKVNNVNNVVKEKQSSKKKSETLSSAANVTQTNSFKSAEVGFSAPIVEETNASSVGNCGTQIQININTGKTDHKRSTNTNGPSTTLHNGFRSTSKSNVEMMEIDETVDSGEELPKNLIKIQIVDLVKRRANVLNNNLLESDNKTTNNVKNFKKFKKVFPAGARPFPKIIGGHELIVHNRNSSTLIDLWLQEHPETQENGASYEGGEFDWDSQPSSRKRR